MNTDLLLDYVQFWVKLNVEASAAGFIQTNTKIKIDDTSDDPSEG